MTSTVHTAPFGQMQSGRPVQLYTLTCPGGVTAQLCDFGARLVRLQMPDRQGQVGDVTLGHDALAGYLDQERGPYFGAIVGRYANRVALGRFTLDAAEYQLPINNGPNHLHGGPNGFDRVLWQGRTFEEPGRRGVSFHYTSPDGEEGYPGEVDVTVRYALSDDGVLSFETTATTDRPTIINISNHAYWNLADGGAGSVLGQHLRLAAGQYLPVSETLIPLGEAADVRGTPFDFLAGHPIGQDIAQHDEQLRRAGGYDHHFALPDHGGEVQWAATLSDPVSGRRLELWTSEPGLQFYSGNFLDGHALGRNGAANGCRSAVCLEPQHAPDSPNGPHPETVTLRPGQGFHSRSEWRFTVDG